MRRRWILPVLLILAAVLAAGCGSTEQVREPPVVVSGGDPEVGKARGLAPDGEGIRIAVVTHGQASSPFWAIVRNGVEAAARQMDVVVDYRAPDIYDVDRQRALIDRAAATRPDGLVVSVPEAGVAPAIRRAVKAGIPTVTINSGSTMAPRLGVLAHVGQPEERAGYEAGRRLAAAGVRHALCVNHQVGNQGLDERCAGLARAMRDAGGTSLVLAVSDEGPDTVGRIAAALAGGRVDGLLALNGMGGMQAIEAAQAAAPGGKVPVASFDLRPEILEALQRGQLLFAVDQQAYLQGYLPVVLLTERARYGLFPAQGGLIPTGPNFVTKRDAAKVIELSRRTIR